MQGRDFGFDGLEGAEGACGKGLRFSERFVIWGVRVWAQSQSQSSGTAHYHCATLRRAFDLAGIGEAHLVFDRLMTAIQAHSVRDIGLHAPRCRSVSPDELSILGIVAGGQAGVVSDALMSRLIVAEGRDEVGRAAQQLAFLLARRGMYVRALSPVQGNAPDGRTVQAEADEPRLLH